MFNCTFKTNNTLSAHRDLHNRKPEFKQSGDGATSTDVTSLSVWSHPRGLKRAAVSLGIISLLQAVRGREKEGNGETAGAALSAPF